MIFDRILIENSVENNGGFTSDYVNLGDAAPPLQNGSKRFFVEFPQKVVAAGKPDKQQKKATNKRSSSKNPSSRTAKKSKSLQKTEREDIGGLQFEEIGVGDSDDDDDSILEISNVSANNTEKLQSVLPHHHTKKLVDQLKTLVQMWANEEQVMGNNVQCKSFATSFLFLHLVVMKVTGLTSYFILCYFRLEYSHGRRYQDNCFTCSYHSW